MKIAHVLDIIGRGETFSEYGLQVLGGSYQFPSSNQVDSSYPKKEKQQRRRPSCIPHLCNRGRPIDRW